MRRVGLLGALFLVACGGGGGDAGSSGGNGGDSGNGGSSANGGTSGGSGTGGSAGRVRLSFEPGSQVVMEGDTVSVDLVLNQPTTEAVTGQLTIGGDASADDHDLMPGPFTIAPGETRTAFQFQITDDQEVEPDEELLIGVSQTMNALTPSEHQVVIADDDTPSTTLTIEPPPTSVTEQNTMLDFTLRLSEAAPVDVVVTLTRSGSARLGADHDLDLSTLVVPAGDTSLVVPFQIFDDAFDEMDETIDVTIDAAPNANLGSPASFTVTIVDDDPLPIVNVFEVTRTVTETDTDNRINVRVSLSAPSGRVLDIPFTVSGTATETEDFTRREFIQVAPPHSLNNGQVNDIVILGDALPEGDETVVITLGDPANATLGTSRVQTITVIDDDTPTVTVPSPTVGFVTGSSHRTEGVGASQIPIQLSAPAAGPVTVPFTVGGTAAVPGDHDLVAGAVVIPAQARAGAIDLTIWSNSVMDGSRNVVVTLGAPTGGTLGTASVHTLTIFDDDQPGILFQATKDDSFGGEVAALGDITGDGVPDFAAAQTFQGETTVYSGADFSELFTVAGMQVAPAGDWNGDLRPDVAIGNRNARNAAGDTIGNVSVYSSAGGTPIAELMGPEVNISFAAEIGGGCDIDGDGNSEVYVSATGFDVGSGEDVGSIYVYSSATGALQSQFVGVSDRDRLGSDFVGCVGDYDGDGVDDLIGGLQHFFNTTTWGAMIFSGVSGNNLFRSLVRDQDYFTVTPMGDFDNDGTDDLSIAYLEDCTLASCQHVAIRTAGTFDVLWSLPVDVGDVDFGMTPSGTTLADFDGDGTQDFVTTARRFDGIAGDDTGKLYVFSGVTREVIYTFDGPVVDGVLGRVVNLGDLDGNGTDELLAGAPASGAFSNGTIYVLTFTP